ncbi:IS6 family transposase [Pararhizobium sp. LjRoot238]|uniref:IS6 family transposase n=1 Tax=Pararhizobium sp. LjRoot238 TaxID=3342293 RepID=UPI003F4F4324
MFEGRHFEQSVILLCVRWYLTYGLSLRDLKEMMAERGISVDHSTIHRWVVHFAPLLAERFNRRKRVVTGKWHADETYLKVRSRWRYLYRAIDSNGCTVEFWLSEHRDPFAAKRCFKKAFARHGRPERVVIDGSQTNREAIISCDTISRLLDRSRRRPDPMLGFKSFRSAVATLPGIEMIHMLRKHQLQERSTASLSIAKQFETLVAAI